MPSLDRNVDGSLDADADACAQEPIHIIGSIQPHGVLIAVTEPDFVVRHVSANIFDLLSEPNEQIVGLPLTNMLGSQQFEAIRAVAAASELVAFNPLHLCIGRPARDFDAIAHRRGGLLLLELEPSAGSYSLAPLNFETHLRGPIARIESQADIAGLARSAGVEIQRASGFDRVSIYRFDADWSGQVIAEVGGAGAWPSYFGHQFPASDIPAQARRLFLLNTLRSIVDVESPPVPIVPAADPATGRPVDLSHSLLRSASPIHLRYLRNMGVRGTMTISIVVRGELWGMVTAHHSTPRRLAFVTRSVCELLGQILATGILTRSDMTVLQERLESRERIEAYLTSIELAASSKTGELLETEPLLDLLHADGIIARIDGVTTSVGTTVKHEQLLPVIARLRARSVHGVAGSNMLSRLDSAAASYAQDASGALYLGLSERSDEYILLLRRERVESIVWAGDPNKSASRDALTGEPSPRASFASWQETLRGTSRPWTQLELENARLLSAHFMNAQLRRHLRERQLQLEQERSRSMLFQQAVLPPHLPTVAGLTFDAVYEPGLSDALVGGDWYDAVRLIDGRVMITIGDVAGSGLDAAVTMGVVRQIMRGIAQLHPEPALMLDAADRALRLEYPEAFVTAWVGVLDLVGRTLTYASAGHPPPLLVEANGAMRELDHRTLPIGLRQGHQGHASTIAMSHASALYLYTDGLIEAEHDIVDGSRRLTEIVSRIGTSTADHPAATVRKLLIPNGSPDDVAILVIHANFTESERYLRRSSFHSANATAAGNARRSFAESLPASRFSEVDIANAEIVYGELCGNVARYAPGLVDVVVDRGGVQTVLHVLDRGIGFRHLSRLPADILSEKGRGLFIIASMTTEFTVTPRDGGGSHARAVLVGRFPRSLLRDETLPAATDQVPAFF